MGYTGKILILFVFIQTMLLVKSSSVDNSYSCKDEDCQNIEYDKNTLDNVTQSNLIQQIPLSF